MKRKIFLSSLTSLAVMAAASNAFADQITTAPDLEGGVTASLGAMFVVPSAANDDYANSFSAGDDNTLSGSTLTVDPDYEWGMLASLGYVFENTANMVELSYRGLFDASSTSSATNEAGIVPKGIVGIGEEPILFAFDNAKSKLEYEHHAADLMFSQFMNLGEYTQIRFSAGVSYIDSEQKQSTDFSLIEDMDGSSFNETDKSQYSGFGPRVGIDGRYDFGQGFGIVAGGSAAYFLGDLDTSYTATGVVNEETGSVRLKNNKSDHGVTNLRGNIGVDYVFFLDNEERSTVGIELGYMADWYDNLVGETDANIYFSGGGVGPIGPEVGISSSYDTHSVLFAGPYLLVKGAF